jgi:hypothetical protein
MRRNYISPEFIYNQVFGTLNMEEESSFFGSKMLEIDDSIIIGNESIVYFQNNNNEQLNIEKELDIPAKIYNTSNDKQLNHVLSLDEYQTEVERNNYAKWIMTIKLKDILKNYIFGLMKKYRSFEGVTNDMTLNKSVDFSLKDYIGRNVVSRYKFTGVDLYLVPIDLLTLSTFKYQNVWDPEISQDIYKYTKVSTITDPNLNEVKLFFSQNFSASQYAFRYYFNLKFEKL